jgi:hypothetical protein
MGRKPPVTNAPHSRHPSGGLDFLNAECPFKSRQWQRVERGLAGFRQLLPQPAKELGSTIR